MAHYLDEEEELPYPLAQAGEQKFSQEYVIPEADKEKILKQMYPFEDRPELVEELFDLHEERLFVVRDFKVVREGGKNYLVSPYYHNSGGTVFDWMPADWAKDYGSH